MKVTFTIPVTVGSIGSQITINSMDVYTLSFNFAPESGAGNIVASITLKDPVSGYTAHFTYEDSTVTPLFATGTAGLSCYCGCGKTWIGHLVQRLLTDAKLPAGVIS